MMRKVATLSLAISLLSGCQYLNSVNQRKLKVVGESKVVAEDRDLDDMFGSILRADGDTLVVGAYRDDDPFPAYEHVSDDGHDAGTAYVFVRDVNGWIQQAKLLPADRVTAGQFGHSVAIAANTIIAGAPRARTGEGVITGAVYVFERQGTVWSQHAKLAPSDGIDFDEFGWSAAISGNTAVVGAYTANGVDDTVDTGAAYIFVRDGANWIEQAKLTASDAATGDAFGVSVAIDGDTVVIGARSDDHAAGDDAGSLYVFSRTGTTWTQQAKLTAGDGAASDGFGTSVAVVGSEIFAGADGVDGDGFGASNVGAVYVFSYNGTDWAEETKLTASDAEGDDHFGFDVSARQGILAVGAYTVNANATAAGRDFGAAYIFMQNGVTWQEQPRLMAADGARDDYFGCSVAVARTAIYAGACRDDAMGSAWVFDIEFDTQEPVADAGPDRQIECAGENTPVTLDGSGSYDPDGSIVDYSWSENDAVIASGVSPTVNLDYGTHTITLTVTDDQAATNSDNVTIAIVDTTAPVIDLALDTTSLWPPEHEMHLVASGVGARDACSGGVVTEVSVTSNEPENGTGDGNTAPDWKIEDNGDGTFDVWVRAERAGTGEGRIYTITVTATDSLGNSTSTSAEITVGHNP
jgi:hypothetical protein